MVSLSEPPTKHRRDALLKINHHGVQQALGVGWGSLRFLPCLCCVTLGQPLYFFGSPFPPCTRRHIQLNKQRNNLTQLLKQTASFWKLKKQLANSPTALLLSPSYFHHHAKIMPTSWWVLLLLFQCWNCPWPVHASQWLTTMKMQTLTVNFS